MKIRLLEEYFLILCWLKFGMNITDSYQINIIIGSILTYIYQLCYIKCRS